MNAIARGARVVGRGLREMLLTLAAAGGVVCIALVIMAYAGGYSLIMFKTGSMSPTIPAGSVALVQRMPAAEVAVGDVVTVDRPGALPITHRVTSVEPGSAEGQRIITMKGDANEAADPAPYTVTEVRIVRGALPHLANVIVWFGNPLVLGGITIGAALLVVWAFWPRSRNASEPESVSSASASVGSGSVRSTSGGSTSGSVSSTPGSLSLSKGLASAQESDAAAASAVDDDRLAAAAPLRRDRRT